MGTHATSRDASPMTLPHVMLSRVSVVASPPDREDLMLVDQAVTAATSSGIPNSMERPVEKERRARQALGQCVSYVERASTLDQRQHCVAHQIQHEVAPDVDVMRELPVHQVVHNLDARHVVLPDNRWRCCSYPNPLSMARRYTTSSCQHMLTATYSASAELSVKQSWCFAFQDTGAQFKLRTY
eukprot:2929541-Rhodomonas_salina.1